MIEPERIRAIVKTVGRLADCPMDTTMHNLGLNHGQLLRIQSMIVRHYHHTVREIFFSDTVYSIADKLNKKPQSA